MSIHDTIHREFFAPHILSFHNLRLKHFDTLGLPVEGKTLLEPGSGPGVFGRHFSAKGYKVYALEGRPENVSFYQQYNPQGQITQFDLEKDEWSQVPACDTSASYGILYHLETPFQFVRNLKEKTREWCVIDTVVSMDSDTDDLHLVAEHKHSISQSVHGVGCRPTRKLLWNFLKEEFKYVYVPYTQPNHEQYPLQFNVRQDSIARCIFIASHIPLALPTLSDTLLDIYVYN